MIVLKSPEEIETMRRAGRIVAEAHALVKEAIRPGVSTAYLDQLVEKFLQEAGAVPAFKGYHGFPASICVSINDVVVHGIPSPETVLQEGSIIAVDIGAFVDGFCGDSAWTYPVGAIDDETQKLLDVTERSLFQGIEKAVVGNRLGDISHAIQLYVETAGYSVVRDFVGHGIGRAMHESPQIPNFGPPGRGVRLKAGLVLALEPMVNAGERFVDIMPDHWAVRTADRSLSAHFEHTVAVTENGPDILTQL